MAPEQQAHWFTAKENTKHLTDGRGMTIDRGILDTVTILRLLGLNTTMSCEGHLDRGYGPYVSFEAVSARADRAKAAESQKKSSSTMPSPETKKIIRKISTDEIAERRKLFPYLDEFYKNRQVPYIDRLAIESLGFAAGILRCQGAVLIGSCSLEPLEQRKKLLARQQQEMRNFTAFLKEKFYLDFFS